MKYKNPLVLMTKIAVTFLVFFSTLTAFSQNLAQSNWYFGNSVNGIRFNRSNGTPSLVNNQAIPFGTGGSAVATDPSTANLLFYSDGLVIYDGGHLQMLNGGGLSGNNSGNQPVATCPVPGQPNKYFVFTNSANFLTGGTISRSVVDMNLFGNAVFPAPAFGDVENPKNVAIPGLTGRSEGMMIVPHTNGIDYWLITHQSNSISYSATLINAAAYTGTFNTTVSTTGNLPLSIANFSYHAGLNKMAIAPQSPNEDAIIFDFNDTNGTFSFDRFIFNTGFPSTSNQEIFDIEWSLTGQYLYISRPGETGVNADVLQYDYLNSNTSTPLTLITSVLGTPVFRSYGLQMAADSSMYFLYQAVSGGPFLVDKFIRTDTIASSVVRVSLPFGNANFGGQQFPSFSPKNNIPLTVSFTTIGSCQNTPTSFFPVVTPAADSLVWDFGDATGVTTGWSPIHTYATAQTFNATLTAFYQGQSQTATQPVNIGVFPLQLNLVQDTTACRSEFPPPRGSSSPTQFSVTVSVQGGTPTSYVWSNGDVGATLRPDSAGYYYVVVSDASGCSAYAGVNVKEYELQDGRGNIWYFGNKAGINFNPLFKTPPGLAVALSNSAMDATEGCAIICDRNGDVIFYTDGDKVYDKTDTQIDVGIGGDPTSSQSSLIVPVPGDETLYYIFTTQAINGTSANELRYSLFDLKQNSGKGLVVKKNILLFGKSTERITASGTWLIAHEYGNNTFRTYQISPQGIGDPVYSSIGSDHSFKIQQNGEGYMKLGPRDNLAVALSTPGTQNLIELFHLNDTTGAINNYRKIDLKEPNGQVYGIEFSPGGNKIFASVKGTPSPSLIFEYFIDSLEQPYFRQQISQPFELGAMQLGPDGQIYVAINGSGVLGTINANEDTTQVSAYNPNGFTLAAGTTSKLGLPNFIQIISNAFGGPSIEVSGLCFGQPTQFVGNATDAIDKFQWFFGDGGSDTAAAPVHTYAAPGTYTVSLRITNRCSLDTTLIQKVTIFAPPPNPTIPGAIALCTGVVILDANTANLPNFTYNWSSGDSTRTVTVTEQSIIAVIITDTNSGCQSTAQSIVVDNRPQLDLGPDVSICEDNSTTALNAQNPGATFQWTINGVNSSNSQAQAIDVTTPGVFTYAVTVTDPISTCTVTDDKTYTIKVSPLFTLTGTNPTGCGSANGTIQLNLLTSAPAGGPYSFFVSGAGGFNDQQIDQTAPNTINYANPTFQIAAGTYSGIVTDQISGCTISTSIGLSDATYTPTAVAALPNCDPVIVNVTSNAPAGALPFKGYTITNSGTGAVTSPALPTTANFSTPGLAAGDYVIQLTDNTNCITTINQTITPNPPVVITLTPNPCATPATITGSGATTYTWTGPGITGSVTGSTLSVPVGQTGLLTYSVTATAAGQCPATQTVDIIVDPAVAANFTQSDACQTAVILTASPSGNYTYRWFRGGVLQPALLGSQVAVGLIENGGIFSVTLVNTLNGCTYSSPPKAIDVVGPIDANLTSTPACLDNQPFTLTASTTATGVSYVWSLIGKVLSPAVTTPITSQSIEGTYKVDITKSVCTASAQLQIIRAPIPAGKLPNRVIICNDPDNKDPNTSKIDLDPGVFTAYNWLKNELTINYTNQVYTADSEGFYKVNLTNSFGCTAPDETEILNQCIPKISAPTAFRPTSGQGANKDFFVFTFFITDDFQVFIYNRWGELVFESKDRNFRWNGGYNNNSGQPLPGGAYAYVIKYVSAFRPDQGVQEKHGGVALIR